MSLFTNIIFDFWYKLGCIFSNAYFVGATGATVFSKGRAPLSIVRARAYRGQL